ncbi:biopolymer transporter ExbD [Pseudoruegeria sp. HB172150]|uniref:ExbD/TolR family protein n=1 Tax=Pseudoruegeria sp. HB172150 TaxID=2721164 RepID=UPI001555D173|nr:biopolymer transporter ExbD [Pseudoruegeria sp. HB172150]
MPLRRPSQRQKGEPTIALINIVFLMLIFFMIAGALAPPLDNRVELVDTAELEGRAPPDAAVVLPDGSLSYRSEPIDVAGVVAQSETGTDAEGEETTELRLVPDRNLPARTLLSLAGELRAAGAGDIWLITQKGLE